MVVLFSYPIAKTSARALVKTRGLKPRGRKVKGPKVTWKISHVFSNSFLKVTNELSSNTPTEKIPDPFIIGEQKLKTKF